MKDSHRFQSTISLLKKDCHKIVKEKNVPGLSIAFVTRDDTVWMEGFGYTDRKKTKKVDENTRFAYQSTGKSMVAAITLKAVQDGLISLDDPLITYYTEFRVQSMYEEKAYEKITFRHLLSHTAGIQEGIPPGVGLDQNGEIHDPTYEERIKDLQNSWLRFPVGQRACYSNFGIDLVTYGLQRASKKPYPQFAKESFFYPLTMTSVIYDREEALKKNTAKGYLGDYEAVIRDSEAYGAGMPFLSIKDLANFARFLLNRGKLDEKTILEQKYFEEMIKGDYSADYFAGYGSKFAHYGLGIFLNSIHGVTVLHHPGRAFGYTSRMVLVPDLDIGVVVFANNEYNDPAGVLEEKALRLMIGECGITIKENPKVDRRNDPPVKVGVETLKNLEGVYSSVEGVDFVVQYKDGNLFLSNHRLTPHGNNEFSSKELLVVRFELHEQGGPKMLTFSNEENGWWPVQFIMKCKDQPPPTRKRWEDFTGLYICYYYGIERDYFIITSEKDHLVAKSSDGEELLYESGVQPGLFFTFNGISHEFVGDVLLVGHVKTFKCKAPVKELVELADTEPDHRYLKKDSLNQLEEMLRYLNREKEADTINELYERLYQESVTRR